MHFDRGQPSSVTLMESKVFQPNCLHLKTTGLSSILQEIHEFTSTTTTLSKSAHFENCHFTFPQCPSVILHQRHCGELNQQLPTFPRLFRVPLSTAAANMGAGQPRESFPRAPSNLELALQFTIQLSRYDGQDQPSLNLSFYCFLLVILLFYSFCKLFWGFIMWGFYYYQAVYESCEANQ